MADYVYSVAIQVNSFHNNMVDKTVWRLYIINVTIDTLYPAQDRILFILCIKSIHYNMCYAYKLLSVLKLDRIVEEQSKINRSKQTLGMF